MIKNNFALILFSLILAIIFLSTPVYSLTYVGEGKWSEYYDFLPENYSMSPDAQQTTYNRDFEVFFDLGKSECDDFFCLNEVVNSYGTSYELIFSTYAEQREDYSTRGEKSLFLYSHSGCYGGSCSTQQRFNFIIQEENVGGKNISFNATDMYALCISSGNNLTCSNKGIIYYGYVDDSNNFTSVGEIGNKTRNFQGDWYNYSFSVPEGNYRLAFQTYALANGSSYQQKAEIYVYIDDISIISTNIGTFSKNYEMPLCSSLESCSNLTDEEEFKSNDERKFFWHVDYFSGGQCSVWENGENKGLMTERNGGIYSYEVQSRAYPNEYVDLNLKAECLKVPYEIKGFYAELTLYEDTNIQTNLDAFNSSTENYSYKNTNILFSSQYLDDLNEPIIDANCSIIADGVSYPITFNSNTNNYEKTLNFNTLGTKQIIHNCSKTNYVSQQDYYNLIIDIPLSDKININPIENISNVDIETQEVFFDLGSESSDLIFSINSDSTISNLPFYFYNSRKEVGKNYFVYASDDGVTWAFDDTITFDNVSADLDKPVQKIWETDEYKYKFYLDVIGGETKYYKLVYQDVGKYWETIKNSVDWVHYNEPSISTIDTKNWDVFSVSELSQLRSQLKLPFSQLLSGDFVRGVHVQFTAYATAEIDLNVQLFGGSEGVGSDVFTITTTPTRFSVLLNPQYSEEDVLRLITTGDDSAVIYITDYHLIPSSYFVDGMTLKNKDGTGLNAIMIKDVGSKEYLREGEPFRISTSVYDREGDLKRLEIRTFADVGSDVLIGITSFDISDATKRGAYFEWNVLVNGIIDLNGNYVNPQGLRDVFVHARLYNNADEQVAQISRTVSLLQYPYFSNDLILQIDALNNKYGENPKFFIDFKNAVPSAFLGLRFVFYEAGNFDNPAYEKIVYASELNCSSLLACKKELLFNDYVYNPVDAIDFVGVEFLVNTEYSLSDEQASSFGRFQPLTFFRENLQLGYRQLDTARVLQVYERQDNIYRADEKIALVLQVRDVPYKDLTNTLYVEMMFNVCDAETGGNCVIHDVNYLPQSTRHDETTGYTYFYFNDYVLDSSGNLLQDGNYLEPIVIIDDLSGAYSGSVWLTTHANKCQSASYGTLFNNFSFNMNFIMEKFEADYRALYGCNGNETDAIVEYGSDQAQRLEIDTDHVTTGGQNHSILCVNTSSQNKVSNLDTAMYCMVLYKQSDEQINSFRFYIANEFSDFSRTNNLEKQYIEIEIPAEKIIFEDMVVMAKTLEAEFQVDTIDTIGELAQAGFDKLFSGLANPFTDMVTWAYAPTGVFTNIGFDFNWNNTFNPNFLNSVFWIKVEGLKVTNQQDYIFQYPELNDLDASYFRRWVNQEKVLISKPKNAKIWILGQDFKPILFYEPENTLIINSVSSDFVQSPDENNAPVYRPTTLRFNFISDMISDNFTQNERLFIPIWFTYLVPPKPFNPVEWITDVLFGENNQGVNVGLVSNPTGFLVHNWFWFILLIMGILTTSLIFKNFKGGGGNVNIYGKEKWGN